MEFITEKHSQWYHVKPVAGLHTFSGNLHWSSDSWKVALALTPTAIVPTVESLVESVLPADVHAACMDAAAHSSLLWCILLFLLCCVWMWLCEWQTNSYTMFILWAIRFTSQTAITCEFERSHNIPEEITRPPWFTQLWNLGWPHQLGLCWGLNCSL